MAAARKPCGEFQASMREKPHQASAIAPTAIAGGLGRAPASRAPRHTRATTVSAIVGASHHPQTAAERAPLATRASSEIRKKRSMLAAAVAPERFMWVFYRAPRRRPVGIERKLPLDRERVLAKQFTRRFVNAHEIAAGSERLRSSFVQVNRHAIPLPYFFANPPSN